MIKPPFPWFGGKSRASSIIWEHFAGVRHYVEPFAGSLAVLLHAPHDLDMVTLNDRDAFIANFWRATSTDPEAVAHHADWPVNEADLMARHVWLVGVASDLPARLEGDPAWSDSKIAGWWVWGQCCWIGSGWCSGEGPWVSVDGRSADKRQLPHMGDAGQGVNRKRPHMSNAGQGVNRKLPHMSDAGQGVNRQLPHMGDAGKGDAAARTTWLRDYFVGLRDLLRGARVACGDWSRVVGPSILRCSRPTAVLLDPPYAPDERGAGLYRHDDGEPFRECVEWCVERWQNGDLGPALRVALCGFENQGVDDALGVGKPGGWSVRKWKTQVGYGAQAQGSGRGRANSVRERIWLSPTSDERFQEGGELWT